MKSVMFTGDRNLVIDDIPVPQVGPREVMIKTTVSAICGTDLHYYRLSEADRAPGAKFSSGHEPVGVVERVGEGVTAVAVGDRVVGYHVSGCGKCESCRSRRFKDCKHALDFAMSEKRHGSNAEFIVLPEDQCLPLPEEFSWEDGVVLACNFGTAYGAVKNAFGFPGGTLAIWGMGPVGLCAVLIAKAVGLRVLALDLTEERLALARQIGADEAVNGSQNDISGILGKMTAGKGPDCVIDTSGSPKVHEILVPTVADRGTVVLVGFAGLGAQSSVGPSFWTVLKQVKIVGSWIYEVDEWTEILDFVRRHRIDLSKVITHRTDVDSAKEMFQMADKGRCGKVVFQW